MPEAEGYLGIIFLLKKALECMPEGDAKVLVTKALCETVRQAKQSVTSLEMGINLGRLLSDQERLNP